MSYLGRSAKLSRKTQEKVSFLATAGQTNKAGLSYVPTFVEVTVNGILLTDVTDYTATSGSSITFTVALGLNDEVTVVSLKTFALANHYNRAEADALLAGKIDNSQVLTNVPSGAVFTDNNTTYTVGDGGLTTNDFTAADHTKLNGVAASANNYSHPTNHAISVITGLQAALDTKAPLASPAITGVPTAPTAAANTNTTQVATTAYVQTELTDLIGGAPGTLDTLNELAAAINDDAAYASTLTTALGTKVTKTTNQALSTSANAMTISGHTITLNRGDGTTDTVTVPDNNTTYSVGDGGLSQINFTSADHSKLNAIEASATADQTAAQILTAVKTVDGSGSGLDADLLDGVQGSVYANTATNIFSALSNQNNPDWYRTQGTTGLYNATYGGGVHMLDTTWVRVYNSKRLYVANEIAASGNITAYYSDERLKTSTGNIENAIDKVKSLNGFTYVENELARSLGYSNTRQQVGISAQQIQAVLPEAVSLAPVDMATHETTGEITSKSGENYLTVDYSRIVPLLIEAIKEQQVQIEELKALIGGA